MNQLEIDVPIERHEGDRYAEALAEYLLKKGGSRTFLCYNKVKKQYYVNWLFNRDFLEFKNIKIIQ